MGLKLAYVILKSFCIVKDISFYAVSGFELNGGAPIRANKILSFTLLKDGSVGLSRATPAKFLLPQNLKGLNLNCDTLPNYIIQAV